MHFEGEFSVPGHPDDVIRRFADVERMARCMPGAAIEGRDEEGNYLGGMLVAFGPKKIKFFAVASRRRPTSQHGTGALRRPWCGRHARRTHRGAHHLCTARRSGEVRGDACQADLGRRTGRRAGRLRPYGGAPFANALMQDFAKRVAEEFATEAPQPAARAEPAPLAAHALLWQVIKAKLAQFHAGSASPQPDGGCGRVCLIDVSFVRHRDDVQLIRPPGDQTSSSPSRKAGIML